MLSFVPDSFAQGFNKSQGYRTSLHPPERVFKQGCGYKQRYKHSQGQPVRAKLERKSQAKHRFSIK